ncbi:MAG: heterocyst-inhibiting protein PatX [Sphaerospermopsis kisseleviana]|jgi:hypothetical protein|uniref:Secreted protein n=2 Tax=Sphaerospermopsis TaxID=752201 RepID=A0A480A9U8_9CYAN|nr:MULTISPECIES: hypothetical protein [Sphaerospermopsis]MBC5794762.1 hypothetical protein [Sphaerospermopsis sp. LEGE 00249]MBE9236093.1 hypothetical protein [Sphaerospermopsis aphanizomenoides LEGE 00250]MEB3149112.1 hypothetical protein [Sphaerospermopsis sp.]GCL38914.1 hypothetical protein SR1949_40330 [Sphaerospermopsis reniformis]
MRAAISLLVSSLVFGSLAFNYEAKFTSLSCLLIANFGSEKLFADNSKPGPNQPEQPAPHRGSGRKESMEFFSNIHSFV